MQNPQQVPHVQPPRSPSVSIPQQPIPIIQKIIVPKKFIVFIIMSIILTAAAIVGVMLVLDVVGKTYHFDNTVGSNIVYRDIEGEREAGVVLPTTAEVVDGVKNSVVEIYATGRNSSGQLVGVAGSGVISHFAERIAGTDSFRQIFITTNNHVIAGTWDIEIRTRTGRTFNATVVGGSTVNDIAILWVRDSSGSGFSADYIASWRSGLSPIVQGENVIVIGNPTGSLPHSVTTGVVSYAGIRQINVDGQTFDVFQVDAAITGGNSGGPVFDDRGLVIGIIGFKAVGNNAENLTFAIHGPTALSVGNQLITNWNSSAERSYIEGEFVLGATFEDKITADINEYPFVQISTIQTSSDAYLGGLRRGHIIRQLIIDTETHDITSAAQLLQLLEDARTAGKIDVNNETKNTVQFVTQNLFVHDLTPANSTTRTITLTQYRIN